MVFERERYLGQGLSAMYMKDPLALQSYGDSLNRHDLIYVAALSLFKPYFCRTADEQLLRVMMRSVTANPGSASEETPIKLAECLRCQPVGFKKVLRSLKSDEQTVLVEATMGGLWLTFNEQDSNQQAERDKLIKALNDPVK
jgi:hypothetical protein